MANEHGTPREMAFSGLMFGDRFRFAGDDAGVSYGPVIRAQEWCGSHFGVTLADGTSHYGGAFRKVVLLHRAPGCGCGVHVDLCEADCEWPAELEELWDSLYSPAAI